MRSLRIQCLCGIGALLITSLVLARPGMAANTWDVPNDYDKISDALADTVVKAGDTIHVSQNHQEGSFVVDKSVTINKDAGATVTITADDETAMSVGADGAVVDGLTFKTGTYGSPIGIVVISGASEVRNCTMLDDGHSGNVYGVDVYNGATLRNCTVTLTSGDGRAVAINSKPGGGYAQILDNTLNVELDSGATQLTGVQYLDGRRAVINGNVITFTGDEAASGVGVWIDTDNDSTTVTHNSILGAGDKGVESWADDVTLEDNLVEGFIYGFYMYDGAGASVERNSIIRSACDSYTYGVLTGPYFGSEAATFANNLIVNTETGLYFGTAVSGNWTISHNAFWSDDSPSCGTGSNRSLSSSQLATDLEPIFCDGHEAPVSKYSHRIDSEVTPGNNPWGELVGRWNVECAWDTLEYDATLLSNQTAIALEDVTVPSGKTLTLEAGSTLEFDEDDNSAGGSNSSKNELIVDGTLDVNGTGGSPAVFTSSQASPSEGDWYGIDVKTGAVAIDHADIGYAVYGVRERSSATSTITNSTFAHNQTYDILGGRGSGNLPLTIAHNSIDVGGGTGIEFESAVNGAAADTNTITGTSSSTAGISVAMSSGDAVSITGNTIGGSGTAFTNGAAVFMSYGSHVVRNNTLSYNKYGIQLSGGTPVIGNSTGTNVISHSTTTGIVADGADPVARHNDISSNVYGVVAKNGANPDLGQSSGDRGLNKFLSNTTYCIWNRNASGTLAAQYNYFGACTGGAPDVCWNGNVDASNAYCTAPWGMLEVTIARTDGEPKGFRVLGAAPNPTSGPGQLFFSLDEGTARVRVEIFDLAGRVVRDFGTLEIGPGEHQVHWDGRNALGAAVGSGIYFVRMTTNTKDHGTAKILVSR